MYNDNLARKHDYRDYSQRRTKTHDVTFGRVHEKKPRNLVLPKCIAVVTFILIGAFSTMISNISLSRSGVPKRIVGIFENFSSG